MREGHYFGELALLFNEPRAATIMTQEDCYFVTINKTDYEKVLKKLELKEINKKADFFNEIPFLKHWTSKQIKRLINSFKLETFKRNQ